MFTEAFTEKRYYFSSKNIQMRFALITLLFLSSLSVFHVRAQDGEMIRLLTQESMVNNSDGLKIELAWLLADPFWEYVINVNPETANTEMGEEFYDIVTEYNIIIVVVGSQSYGRLRFTPEEELRKKMSLKGQDGKNYQPLQSSQLSDKLNMMLDIFNPIFAQMLGEMGANMRFFVFEKENKNGELIFDPTSDKDVSIKVDETVLTWNLPMSSLVPKKRCPKDNEMMNGTWNYCPIHGNELEKVEE